VLIFGILVSAGGQFPLPTFIDAVIVLLGSGSKAIADYQSIELTS
jgi:hypothetical protein